MRLSDFLSHFCAVIARNDGRDKVVKVLQYTLKLHIFMQLKKREKMKNSSKMLLMNPVSAIVEKQSDNYANLEQVVIPLAKQMSKTRSILRFFKCLKFHENWQEACKEDRSLLLKYCTCLCTIVGACGEFGDDVVWASEMGILPSWIEEYDDWPDKLWLLELCLDMPLLMYDLVECYGELQNLNAEKNKVEYHNTRVELMSLSLSQVKMLADFFHAGRLAYGWPTNSKGQDALCGLISASISLLKIWKPQFLVKVKS